MKVVIFAGGYGSRLSEETSIKPKPMVEIGGKPILWHIMKIYSSHNVNEFIICLGYKGYLIKEYFANYFLHMSDVTFCMKNNDMTVHKKNAEPWKITLIDTGLETMTGGRLKRVREYINSDEDFCLTYGDGVSNVDISSTIDLHKTKKRLATLTAVQPPGRFGALEYENDQIKAFKEKPQGDGSWVNGGFFVLSPGVFDYITDDTTSWEKEPMNKLANEGQMSVYFHNGFWQCMDTIRDRAILEKHWQTGSAPWKTWS